MCKISDKIKERRKELGMTQIEVSEKANVAKNSCRRIESGDGYNFNTLKKICGVLGLRIEIKYNHGKGI